jgi:TFIIF-interacting CTD phosphatase-like protein
MNIKNNEDKDINNLTKLFEQMSILNETCENKKKENNILVLDLDETLVHAIQTTNENKINKLKNMDNLLIHYLCEECHIFIFYRPYLLYFLQKMSQYFNICIFTNGIKSYADIVITMINTFTSYKYISNWYTRTGNPPYYKYISLIDNATNNNSIIIDDNIDIWKDDTKNVIKIKQFFGPDNDDYIFDNELLILADIIDNSLILTCNTYSTIYDVIDNIKIQYNIK